MKKQKKHPQPVHIEFVTIAAATMALVLALGLKIIHLSGRIDEFLTTIFLPKGMKDPTLTLNPIILWVSTALLALLIPSVILRISGNLQRYLIFTLSLVLTIFWAPILLLSSHKPEISIAIIAVSWAGFCAIFYAHNHRLPIDGPVKPSNKKEHAPR